LKLNEFDRLVEILKILQFLATSHEFTLLNPIGATFNYNHQDEARINKIYDLVATNYGQNITVEQAADIANLTVPSFCRYFKKITQQTFTDFLNEYRIAQACKLLANNDTISDIAFACGFNNLSHFTKTFKTTVGQTPRDYRKGL
jgi:AraC-like DNA-binding protein